MKKGIAYALLSSYLLIMSYYFFTHQYYNADIEAYMGLVYKANYPDMKIKEIHQKVYSELKDKNPRLSEVNTQRSEDAEGDNSYYKILSENPKAYEEELQLFAVKPMYNFINSVFFKAGFPASTSTFLISIISYVLIVMFSFIFLLKNLKNVWLALIFSILISLFKPLVETTRHATPDGLSTLLLLLSIYFAAAKRNLFLGTVFGMLCILTRPEYLIFYSILLALAWIFKNDFRFRTQEIIFSFTYLLLTFSVIQYFNQIPWTVLFMNQFTKVQIYPISNPDAFNFGDYLTVIKSKFFFEFNASYFTLFLIFIFISVDYKLLWAKNRKTMLFVSFWASIYFSIMIRYLMFPSFANRMMIGFYLLLIISLIMYKKSNKQIIRNAD